jgi:hypothetical protein
MSQSRKHSMVEVIASTVVGFVVAMAAQIIIFPLYGLETHIGQDFQIAGIFTVISVIRSYIFRRIFNHLGGKR